MTEIINTKKQKKKRSSPHLTREPLSFALLDKKKKLCLSGTLINSLWKEG